MYLFSFLVLPATILLIFNKITPKEVFSIISGIIISLILSVVFWSFSTFYNPSSFSFIGKFLFILLREYLSFIVFTIYLCFMYYKDNKTISNFFLSGFLISLTFFSVSINYNSNSLYIIFFQPIMFCLYLYIYSRFSIWRLEKIDRLIKTIYLALFPFLLILLKHFFNTHLTIFFIIVIVLVMMFALTYLNRNRLIIKND